MGTRKTFRNLASAALLPLLACCGGGEDEGGGGSGGFEFDGYFTGTLTPDGSTPINSFLYVAQNGKFYVNALPKAQFAGQGASLAGAYSGGSESGTYTYQWNQSVSSRPASLGAIAGTYRYPATGTQIYTVTINSGCPTITTAITGHGWMTADNAISLFGVHSNLPVYVSATR